MENFSGTLQCFSEVCQAFNHLSCKICHRCGLPLVKRYLWATNNSKFVFNPGELIAQRYLSWGSNVFLDTMPKMLPEPVENLPRSIQPYLKLSHILPHIPQVFGKLSNDEDIWLLEYGTVPIGSDGEPVYLELLPTIEQLWSQSSPLQQISWLLQLTRLWEPLNSQGVLSTLLRPSLLRVNGDFVQFLELNYDHTEIVSLEDLGKVWLGWVDGASLSIKTFLYDLCQKLENKEITQIANLLPILENAQREISNFYHWSYSLHILSDQGPSREQNEDCCYPPSGTLLNPTEDLLALVCDGIGGQDSGEIASQMAIDSLKTLPESLTPTDNIYQATKKAIFRANDLICQRNDREMRSQRQRMGTTLMMGLVKSNNIYLANVGDSRVYWITQDSCLRLSVDDDVASRSVKLGISLYREALDVVNSGALTQALGTTASSELYPNLQRQLPNQDCVILLTSDGLSDYDRIEQYWQSELLPLLRAEKELAQVGQNLISLANQKNGHDNTTIALILCRLTQNQDLKDFSLTIPTIEHSILQQNDQPRQNRTKPITAPANKKTNNKIHRLIWLVGAFVLLGAGCLYFLSNNYSSRQETTNTSKIQTQ
ncbi:MAG: protein phosphatase 2C domain-containing protein [Cyanobacteriota bacterium ELA615]